MKKFIFIQCLVILAVGYFYFAPGTMGATTCGFGTDLGNGECQGFITATSTISWSVPSDWNGASNTIEVIGAGGGGGAGVPPAGGSGGSGGGGGGAGSYAEISNLALSGSISIQVGVGGAASASGTDTYFNGFNCATASVCGAHGTGGFASTVAGVHVSGSVGTIINNGGDGAAGSANSGQTGGAGGGAGGAGGICSAGSTASGASGGAGDGGGACANGSGGSGGPSSLGGNGTEWDASHGSGGGGGAFGGSSSGVPGQGGPSGGFYGAGGAGGSGGGKSSSNGSGGAGIQGIIVITYNPNNVTGYAWGDKMGWVSFSTNLGNLTVYSSSIQGYAWNKNFGWINFGPLASSTGVLNDGAGNLSGYAWSAGTGYINFNGVTIDSSGTFHGVASGTIAGNIQFDSSTGCTYCNVVTAWTAGGAPVVSSVTIDGNNPSAITLTPAATTNVDVEAMVTDRQCSEITGATTTILLYRSGVTSSSCLTGVGNGVASNVNCYIANAFTASSTCSLGTINTTTTFAVQYYAQATDASSSYPNQNWMATVSFNDSDNIQNSADSTSATSSNNMLTMVAIGISTTTIQYGTVNAGSNTGPTNQNVVVSNVGNASTTLSLSGSALFNGTTNLATSSEHYATTTFTFGGNEQALSDAVTTVNGFSALPPIVNFPLNQLWTNTSALPYGNDFLTSVAYNGYLYTIGGVIGGFATSTVLYAPINATGSLGAWTSTEALPSYPFGDKSLTSAAYNGYLYIIGGNAGGGLNATSTVLYAPINATGSLGAWTSTEALPYGVLNHGSVVYNGYLYTIGGELNNLSSTSTVLYAPINATGSLGAWTSTEALPYGDDFLTSVAYNGSLYTIGGSAAGSATSTVLYAPINATGSLGAWTSTEALPYGDDFLTSVAYNGSLYTIGGSAAGSATSTVLYAPINATGSLGAWTSTEALPYGDQSQASVAYNGYLYNIGGLAGSVTSTVLYAALGAHDTYWGASVSSTATNGLYTGNVTFTANYSP